MKDISTWKSVKIYNVAMNNGMEWNGMMMGIYIYIINVIVVIPFHLFPRKLSQRLKGSWSIEQLIIDVSGGHREARVGWSHQCGIQSRSRRSRRLG